VDAEVGRRVDIALNLQYIKSTDEVLEAVAHEVAHVVAGTDEHDNKFAKTRDQVLEKLRQEYYLAG